MKIPVPLTVISLALLVPLAWTTTALATDDADKAAARELSTEAKLDFDEGRCDDAARKFQQAFSVAQVPTLAVWTARAQVKCGKWVAASESYRKIAQLTPNDLWLGHTQEDAQAEASNELAALLPRIPRIRIGVTGAAPTDVEVTLNGAKILSGLIGVDRLTDPGHQGVVGRHNGEVIERAVDLQEGERQEVELQFGGVRNPVQPIQAIATPIGTPPVTLGHSGHSNAQRQSGWVVTGVGAAGLLTGTVTGIIVAAKYSSLNCPNNVCVPGQVDPSRVNSYTRMRTISEAGFIVGAVATAAGVTLLLTSPKQEAQASAALWLGAGSVGAIGTF